MKYEERKKKKKYPQQQRKLLKTEEEEKKLPIEKYEMKNYKNIEYTFVHTAWAIRSAN